MLFLNIVLYADKYAKIFIVKNVILSIKKERVILLSLNNMTLWTKFLIWCGWKSPCCGAKIYIWSADIFGDRQRGFCKNCNSRI